MFLSFHFGTKDPVKHLCSWQPPLEIESETEICDFHIDPIRELKKKHSVSLIFSPETAFKTEKKEVSLVHFPASFFPSFFPSPLKSTHTVLVKE